MIIINYPDYDVSEDGIVTRVVDSSNRKYKMGHVIKHYINKDGYYRVNLSNENRVKHYSIHRLIAEHFIPNPNSLECIDHINGIKTDNRIENLRWATRAQNQMNMKGKGYIMVPNGKFRAQISVNNKSICLGTFTTELEATQAYKEACLLHRGEYARK